MTNVIHAAEMRAIEAAAMASGAVSGRALMERAGAGVVAAILARWHELADGARRAVVLCGPGNNGGDGLVVARLLRAEGWQVTCFLFADPNRIPPDARANLHALGGHSAVTRLTFPSASELEQAAFCEAASHQFDLAHAPDADAFPAIVVIDALFGLGLNRPVTGLETVFTHWDYLAAFRDLTDTRLVAVDQPSGLHTDTGEVLMGDDPFAVLCADLTITFHKPKPVHIKAATFCGQVVVADIGL